jgi:hypothetical protein
MQASNRTYLWVHLTLDLIESDIDIDRIGIVNATSHLPKTIEEAYDRIRSKGCGSEKAKRILHIIIAAARPLGLGNSERDGLASTIRENRRSFSDLDLKSKGWFHGSI